MIEGGREVEGGLNSLSYDHLRDYFTMQTSALF